MTSYTVCPACQGRIPEKSGDLVLSRRDGSEKRVYHVECYTAAAALAGSGEGKILRTWTLSHRPAIGDKEDAA